MLKHNKTKKCRFSQTDIQNNIKTTKKDFQQHLRNIQDEKKALEKCRELALKENLNMTIIDANYNFDKSQLIFRFLADERIDFRKLAKD